MKPELLIEIGIAVGTIGAVVVALFGNLRGKISPPKLILSLSPDAYQADRNTSLVYYHLNIRNARRWMPATQTQVFITRIAKIEDEKDVIVWTGELPMRWRYQEQYPIHRTIGGPKQVDLCFTVGNQNLKIEPQIKVDEFPGDYPLTEKIALTVQARSVETDTLEHRIEISWDDKNNKLALEMTELKR